MVSCRVSVNMESAREGRIAEKASRETRRVLELIDPLRVMQQKRRMCRYCMQIVSHE